MATRFDELWPPAGLTVTSGDLRLTPVVDDDLTGLVDLVRDGVHGLDEMPFLMPWTRAPADELPRNYARWQWQTRSSLTPTSLHLELAVRVDGELVGCQGFRGEHYDVVRSVETGSWLARRFHGRGIGTRMRQAVCALLFDHLGAVRVTSGAFADNPASRAVSTKVGYRGNGEEWVAREGRPALLRHTVLERDDLVRGGPVEVIGAEPLRRFLGVGD